MIAPARLLRNAGRLPELFVAWRKTVAFREVTLRYLGVGKRSYPFDIELPSGNVLRVSSQGEVKVFWQIYIHKCYRLPADTRVIVDAGANVGIFSVWAATQLPEARIIAIEPFPETFVALQENIELNCLQERVRTLRVALGVESGTRLMGGGSDSPTRRLIQADSESGDREAAKVRCISLADLFEREQLSCVDLLKMDIEGSEWEVLLNAPARVLESIHHIQLEYHELPAHLGYSPKKLFAHLESTGHILVSCHYDQGGAGIAMFERR